MRGTPVRGARRRDRQSCRSIAAKRRRPREARQSEAPRASGAWFGTPPELGPECGPKHGLSSIKPGGTRRRGIPSQPAVVFFFLNSRRHLE